MHDRARPPIDRVWPLKKRPWLPRDAALHVQLRKIDPDFARLRASVRLGHAFGVAISVRALVLAKAGETREAPKTIAQAIERDPNLGSLRGSSRFVELMSLLHKEWRHFKQLA